jgi:hypothetical protein
VSGGASESGAASSAPGERAATLPAAVRRRFPGYAEAGLLAPANRDFVVSRLMEEGSGEELRWLVRTIGGEALASLLARRGGRALSRRSRAFWARLLGERSAPPHPLAHEIWPHA